MGKEQCQSASTKLYKHMPLSKKEAAPFLVGSRVKHYLIMTFITVGIGPPRSTKISRWTR